jgi:iron-sulfur cluster assembly protein
MTTAAKSARPRPQIMRVTPAAVARLKELAAGKAPDTVGLKIGVTKGGCAGMEYVMSWADKLEPFDEVIEVDGARVVVDKQAVMYLLGTEMDYRADKLSAKFVFDNPNQKGACGCGESVNLVPVARDQVPGSS